MQNKKVHVSILVAVLFSAICSVLLPSPTYAEVDKDSILKKWSTVGMFQCLRNDGVASSIDMVTKKAIFLNGGTVGFNEKSTVSTTIFSTNSTVGLPSYGFAGTSGTMNCREMIASGKNGSSIKSALNYYYPSGINLKWNDADAEAFLKNTMKYSAREDETGGNFSIHATLWECTQRNSNKCLTGEAEWSKRDIGSVMIYRRQDENDNNKVNYNYEDKTGNFFSKIQIKFKKDPSDPENDIIVFTANTFNNNWLQGYSCTSSQNNCTSEYKLTPDIHDLANKIRNDYEFSTGTWVLANQGGGKEGDRDSFKKIEFTPSNVVSETSVVEYTLPVNNPASVVKSISGKAPFAFSLSDSERYNLYAYYIEKAALGTGSATAIQCSISHIDGLAEVKLLDSSDNTFKKCDVNFNSVDPKTLKVYTQGYDATSTMAIVEISIQDVIDWLNKLDTDSLNPADLYGINGKVDLNSNVPSAPYTDKCMDSAAAESLGWIICPILNLTSRAVEWLYDEIVSPFLEIRVSLFDTNSGTFAGWQVFQNIANIAAVILLLIVIFSQVTGVGIDNYGIKKILPKFITAMVLINLSFIICQFAVDASNIIGKGAKSMFDNLGQALVLEDKTISLDGVSANAADLAKDGGSGATTATAVSAVALIGVLVAFIAVPGLAAAILPGLLLGLLGTVIGMLVAIFVMFALLTLREIAVVVLVVISPLAIVCYALPNTKKLFDKWLNLLKNMLVLFPICGLVIGAGNFVSRVILQGDNISFALALGGMLASIVPFFFVPTLLKGSMNVLGGIGSKLGGLSKTASARARGAVAGSDRFKDFQKQSTMARNKAIYDRLAAKEKAGGTLSAYQRRRMNNARTAYNAAAREDVAATYGGAMLTPGSTALKAAEAAQESATNKQELDNQIIAMAKETDNYDADKMYDQLSGLLGSDHELGHEDEVKMKALMQQLTTKGGYGKKLLAKAAGNATTATRAQAAKFMSKNGDVAAAMNKNMAVAQYLRDVNAGTTKETSFQDWFTKGTHKLGDGRHVSNSSFVLSSVITDDKDFVSQSAGAVETMVNAKESTGEWSLSSDRLSAMVNNERLLDSADSDVRNAIIAAAKARNLSIPVRYGGTPAPAAEAPGAPAPVAPEVPKPADTAHTVSVSQGAPDAATDSGTINLHEETPKRSSITIATEADLNRTLADIQQRARQGENIIQAADRINHERGQNNGQPPATQ